MAEYHVVFGSDINCFMYMFVTAQTVVNSTRDSASNADDKLVFHAIVDESVEHSLAEKYVQKFCRYNEKAKVAVDFEIHHITHDFFDSYPEFTRFGQKSYAAYFRLMIGQMLPPSLERCLYLDIDILVNEDIRQMFQRYPIDDNIVYGVNDWGFHCKKGDYASYWSKQSELVKIIPAQSYINSGVLLLNLKEWRSNHVEQKCFEVSKEWAFRAHDQDLINFVCQGRIGYMDWDWDFFVSAEFWRDTVNFNQIDEKYPLVAQVPAHCIPSAEELTNMVFKLKIVHFLYMKPWNVSLLERVFAEEEWLRPFIPLYRTWVKTLMDLCKAFNDE